MKNKHRLSQWLLGSGGLGGVLVMTGGIAWIGIFGNPLDAMRLRIFKRCDGCRFEFSNADFSDAELAGASLNGLNLSGRDFSRANLQHANLDSIRSPAGSPARFQRANLKQTTLSHADLPGSDFSNAQLEQANLQHSDLTYANFMGANFRQANLTGARLTGAKLQNANFREANLTQAKLCFLPSLPDLTGAILQGAVITGEGKGFTLAEKQALTKRGAIVGGASENCYR
jgi:uncharacterized protein YjbI with pentapeptide repeats